MVRIPTWLVFLVFVGTGAILVALSGFSLTEGFVSGMPGVRCGVDLPGCRSGEYCMNGFCSKPIQPPLPMNSIPTY